MSKQLSIISIPITDLKAAAYNPRKHSPEQLEQLKTSIAKFGLCDPLIVNGASKRKNIVIGGHMRLKAAQELGHTEVPVVYVNIPDLEKEKELNLRLNRNTGEWDMDLLKAFDAEFLLDIGFDDTDLTDMWDDVLSVEDDEFDVEKELEEIKKPKAKLGDIYQLGKHRVACLDSTDPESVRKLMETMKVDTILMDPIYNIGFDYDKGLSGKSKYGGTVDDSKSDDEYKEFLRKALVNGLSVCHPDAHAFTFCDQKYIWLLQTLYAELGIENKRVCLWVKDNASPTPQTAFNKQYEPVVYGTIGRPYLSDKVFNISEIMNKEIGTGNRTIEDIYDLIDLWMVKRLSGASYEHPTQKPPALYEKPLRRCTKPGDKVLDLFGGSGSLLIACEQLKRSAYLIEKEPIFVDLIIRRYESLTHDTAKKIN